MKYRHIINIFLVALLSLAVVTSVDAQKRHQYNVVIYTIRNDGTLWWYNYKGEMDGTSSWDEPKQVGNGWQGIEHIFSSKGKIYAIKEDGTLWWYNHKGAIDGTSSWDEPKQVGTGWQNLLQIFSSNGMIYAVKEDGTLWWYNHKGAADGTPVWDSKQVGTGWQDFKQVFSSNGKIYAIKQDGTLWWYNHKGVSDGSFSWDEPKQVGTGWQDFKQVFGSRRKIYAIKEDGTLWLYNHKGAEDGTFSWDDAKEIGEGWGDFSEVTPRLFDDVSPPDAVASSSSGVTPSNAIVLPIIVYTPPVNPPTQQFSEWSVNPNVKTLKARYRQSKGTGGYNYIVLEVTSSVRCSMQITSTLCIKDNYERNKNGWKEITLDKNVTQTLWFKINNSCANGWWWFQEDYKELKSYTY